MTLTQPIIWACIYNRVINIGHLLLRGADYNHKTDDNITPLKIASLNIKESKPSMSEPTGEAIRWLLNGGAKVLGSDLKISLFQRNYELFSSLLNKYLSQEVDSEDISILLKLFTESSFGAEVIGDIFMFASTNGDLETIKFILENSLENSNFMRYSDSTKTKLISPLYLKQHQENLIL